MPKTISEREAKEIEKYDYIRAELFEKGRKPYTSRPLTNYEKTIIKRFEESSTYGEWPSGKKLENFTSKNAKSYADIPSSTLQLFMYGNDGLNELTSHLKIIEKMIKSAGKDFEQSDVDSFLNALKALPFSKGFFENKKI